MGVNSIMVTGEHISQLYKDYTQSLLTVNRTYQRKLVWSLEEKQALIETILKGYPIPLFLFVSRREVLDTGKSVTKREIIDGLQRLEAIISFINNKFPVKVDGVEKYFNLSSFPGPTLKVLSGELHQKSPVLDIDTSNAFSQYYLAVTTIEADEIGVEDVFKRINTTGRQLSAQELRQAGVTSEFSKLVQRIASRMRGDFTPKDIIPLENMEDYSLSNKKLPYGLDIRNIFWTKHNIMSYDGLRHSKDEEIIAHICNSVLNEYQTYLSKKTLDSLYDETSQRFKHNEEMLTPEVQIIITTQTLAVFEDLGIALDYSHTDFKTLVAVNPQSRNTDLVFILLFIALYQLKTLGYCFADYGSLARSLNHIADEELSQLITATSISWNLETRTRWIERLHNRLKKYMHLKQASIEADKELYKVLSSAIAEEQMYDFKMGITTLTTGSFNKDMLIKCVKTLVAMANTNPGKTGYVIIGIANDETAAKEFETHYGCPIKKCDNLYITGVEAEAVRYYHGMDGYVQKIKATIENLKGSVTSEVTHSILTSMHLLPYADGHLVVLQLSANTPLFFDGKFFVRYQSSNKELELGSPEWNKALSLFYDQKTSIFSST